MPMLGAIHFIFVNNWCRFICESWMSKSCQKWVWQHMQTRDIGDSTTSSKNHIVVRMFYTLMAAYLKNRCSDWLHCIALLQSSNLYSFMSLLQIVSPMLDSMTTLLTMLKCFGYQEFFWLMCNRRDISFDKI